GAERGRDGPTQGALDATVSRRAVATLGAVLAIQRPAECALPAARASVPRHWRSYAARSRLLARPAGLPSCGQWRRKGARLRRPRRRDTRARIVTAHSPWRPHP